MVGIGWVVRISIDTSIRDDPYSTRIILLFKTNCIRCQFRLGVVVQISGNSSAELGCVVYFTVLGACYPIEKAAGHDHPQLKAISFKFITCARPGGWMDAAAVGEDH